MKDSKVTHEQRRIHFIEKKFQAKFILRFCALVVIGGLLTIGLIYLLALQSTTVSIINSRVVARTTAYFILPILIQTVAVVTIAVGIAAIILTLLVSHKIAGPLYRFKKVIGLLEKGDFSGDFHIRHYDELQDLAQVFDKMIKEVRERLNNLKDSFLSLKKAVDDISEGEILEHKRSALNELKVISEKLNQIVQYFKT